MAEIIASTYEIIEKIGSGGGGNVYLANHLRLGKKVVLKADKRKITTRPEFLRREVDILKELSHTYIPQVYDFFVEGETVYTVMDYIEGESLDKPLKRGERFSQPQVIKWATQLLEALCYLHSPTHGDPPRGYVHSDIKPANLMRTLYNDVILIDFNIALALGEENVIGRSAGYASPEHYGLDYSSVDVTHTVNRTETVDANSTVTLTLLQEHSKSSGIKKIVPDTRSDIYSVGATLYHLLSGKRPSNHALEVEPLSKSDFSPQIVDIIAKAMNPNPNLRYQTAEEMLDAFLHLRENDIRTIRFKRRNRIAAIVLGTLFLCGTASAIIGLKRIQIEERSLRLAEYSERALKDGDKTNAIQYAMDSLSMKKGIFEPPNTPQGQKALTEALGVYDLSDSFKAHLMLTLPSEPLKLEISPKGTKLAALYAFCVAIYDTETGEKVQEYPLEESALSDLVFLDEENIVFAGNEGICACNISDNSELWRGESATQIAVSSDKSTIAAVYKDAAYAVIYDVKTGSVKEKIEFQWKHQEIAVNDTFADPDNNILSLNSTGNFLAVSFSDGTLCIYDLNKPENQVSLVDSGRYSYFQGGFCNDYFAFSAAGADGALFAVIDTNEWKQVKGYQSDARFLLETDESDIHVAVDNRIININPVNGDEVEMLNTQDEITAFRYNGTFYVIAMENQHFAFYNKTGNLMEDVKTEYDDCFLSMKGDFVAAASRNSPNIRIMKLKDYADAELFTYDPLYVHDEARVSEEYSTVILFRYDKFRLYDMDGTIIKDFDIPNAENVYDQQFVRDEQGARLEVSYYDGSVVSYSAKDGSLIDTIQKDPPEKSADEVFFTDKYKIVSPMHGAPTVYDRNTDKEICSLEKDAYLTYVTQMDKYIVTEYVSADGSRYGLLLNDECEILARLPNLCDIISEYFVFDEPSGHLRISTIYSLEELYRLGTEVLKNNHK